MKQPPMPGMRDRAMLAAIANGVPRTALARREGVCSSAVTMRANRLGRARGLSTGVELIAAAVRDGWIVYDGKAWQPNPLPEDATAPRDLPAPAAQIRRWAEANGHAVSASGPLSEAVIGAYEKALASRQRRAPVMAGA